MVENKPSCFPEGNDKKTDRKNNGKASNPKRYRSKKNQKKNQGPELESNTNFKGRWSDLECYIFELGQRSWDKFSRMMKDPDQYLGETYINSCQIAIMNETQETTPYPEMLKIIPDTGVKRTKTDA